MKIYHLAFLLLLSRFAGAQECNCPAGGSDGNDGKPFITFHFNNGHELGICGYQTVDGPDTTYTQFVVFDCAGSKTIKEWGATKTCKLEKKKDTLTIMDIYGLPIGQSFSTIRVPFYLHKFFFKNGELQEVDFFKKGLAKYSKSEIDKVIAEYKSLPAESSEQTMHVASMLFCAYMSGSKEAENCLLTVTGKFAPFNLAIQQEWDEIFATYKSWKEKNNTK